LTFELRDPSCDVVRKMEKILLQQTEETQEQEQEKNSGAKIRQQQQQNKIP